MSIKPSPKHGLNPTIPICFWCGEDKNEIALMGRIDRNDSEAPKRALLDFNPCDNCKKAMESGVSLIEVAHAPVMKNQPPVRDNIYLTGRFLVLKAEAANRLIPPENHGKTEWVTGDHILIEDAAYQVILDNGQKANARELPSDS